MKYDCKLIILAEKVTSFQGKDFSSDIWVIMWGYKTHGSYQKMVV